MSGVYAAVPSPRRVAHGARSSDGTTSYTAASGQLRVKTTIDTLPQTFQRLERQIVEDGQQFGSVRNFSPPEHVGGVGLDAAWLPDLSQLITASHRALVTVSVRWPHTRAGARRGLAVRIARGCL